MKIDKLENMVRGWFVGPFTPTVYNTDQFEVAVKRYQAGDSESRHLHKIATEITLIVEGSVLMNDAEYTKGDIITIPPGEATDFHAITDATTAVVKVPAVLGDKYEC